MWRGCCARSPTLPPSPATPATRRKHSARELFLDGYLDAVQSAGILPPSPQLERLISIFELEKVVYELRYELDHRPDWVHIPVSALERMLDHEGA